MLLKKLYMYITGVAFITIEGFGIKNFINSCRNNKIVLWEIENKNGVLLKCIVSKDNIECVQKVVNQSKCQMSIDKKIGIPFLVDKYKKRKIFAITICVIAFFILILTSFIWNISIIGNSKISNEEVLSILGNHGIIVGKSKINLELDKIINQIREERDDISWIGIKLKGTNIIVEIEEAIDKIEIINKNQRNDIFSDKCGEISKLIVRNGTARVNIGDIVNTGDLLIEGIIEGKYTDPREVYSDADIYVKNTFEKQKKEKFIQYSTERTGRIEKNVEIYLNNFRINLNKGVSKFENYDTIKQYKKVKLFSNYYLPIEIVDVIENEVKQLKIEYSPDELKEKIKHELYEELIKKLNSIDNLHIECIDNYEICEDGINAKLVFTVEEKIGIN